MRRSGSNLLRHPPKTRREAFWLLVRLQNHFARSGDRRRQRFAEPKAASAALDKVIAKLNGLWRRHRPDLLQPLLVIKRRKAVRQQERVRKLFPAPVLRQPELFGRGFLRCEIAAGAANPMFSVLDPLVNGKPREEDRFLAGHRVEVLRRSTHRFDIVSEGIRLLVAENVSRQMLRKTVEWNETPPASDPTAPARRLRFGPSLRRR